MEDKFFALINKATNTIFDFVIGCRPDYSDFENLVEVIEITPETYYDLVCEEIW